MACKRLLILLVLGVSCCVLSDYQTDRIVAAVPVPWAVELKKQNSACLELVNKTDQCVAFKVTKFGEFVSVEDANPVHRGQPHRD
jgi:hypothetical protein